MPRRRRHFPPGLSVHVIQRGHNCMNIFHDDRDRQRFLAIVRGSTAECGVGVHAYVLMTNHTHMLATPDHRDALPRAMQKIGSKYTRFFNRKYGRIGTPWNGRYRAIVITDDRYWLTCLRYIEQNPVRAHIVLDPSEYRWSSYRFHAFGEASDWLVPHDLYSKLGATPKARQAAYRAICGLPLDPTELMLQRRPPSADGEGENEGQDENETEPSGGDEGDS